jgi:hypothetical protein
MGIFDIGGVDAFGFHYSQPVVDLGSFEEYCSFNWNQHGGEDETCVDSTESRAEADEQNVVHTHQDKAGMFLHDILDPLNPYSNIAITNSSVGALYHMFRTIGSSCFQVWSTYAHTYDDSVITGFSLGIEALGIQWAPLDKGWKKTSVGSSEICPGVSCPDTGCGTGD